MRGPRRAIKQDVVSIKRLIPKNAQVIEFVPQKRDEVTLLMENHGKRGVKHDYFHG